MNPKPFSFSVSIESSRDSFIVTNRNKAILEYYALQLKDAQLQFLPKEIRLEIEEGLSSILDWSKAGKEILLPKNKPSLIVMATDGFEENHPIWEMMTAMKDLTNKLKPTDIINEVMTKTGHYSDDMTLVCTRIIP
jgi:hypothetical protein